jgi:branched-chain amino acid transport system substrate-binding protein
MLSAATAQFATQEFPGVKSWRGVGPEYSFGTEVWDSFQQDLKKDEQGVSFPKNVYIPLTETQFSSYITSLQSGLPKDSASTNGLFMSTFSATTVGLAQQAKPFNLFGDFKAVLNLGGSTPTAVSLGKDTPPLYFIYDYDNQAYNNAMNTAFVSTYQKAHGGNLPDSWTEEGYAALLAYQAGATAAKSDGATKIASSLAGVSFQTPKGTMSFRKGDHVPLTPVSIWKVESAPSAKQGFKVTSAVAIPAAKVVPPVDAH